MNIRHIALRNISGNPYRCLGVVLCAGISAVIILASAFLLLGADESLHRVTQRLGADVLVVPGEAAARFESSFILGQPANAWMPYSVSEAVRKVPGVQAASYQIHLATLKNASCCSVSNMFLMVYDPETDFIIAPWLKKNLGAGLKTGEAVGGSNIFVPAGEKQIKVYGFPVTLRGNLEATGTGLDRSLFLSRETALAIARGSTASAEAPLIIPENSISTILVKVRPEYRPATVARDIEAQIQGIRAMEAPEMFRIQRADIDGLRRGLTASFWAVSLFALLLSAMIFSIIINERRRELGVMRALGANRSFVFRVLMTEAGILGLEGSLAGSSIAILALLLFRNLISRTFGIPFIAPSSGIIAALAAISLAASLAGVLAAALVPAYRISRADPSMAMRE